MANQVTVEKFVDVSRFFLAVSAVEQALTLTENPTPALLKHLKAADPLIKIAAGFLDAGIDSILRETFDKAKIRNKSLLDRALTGGTLSSYGKRASFLQDQLPRLQTHAPAVKDSFGDDFALMRKVIEAAAIENPSARVFALAEFRMADGKLMRLKKWVEKASELFGNPVSDMDTLATDLIAVDSATDALISVQAKAAAKDPTDPESVALKAQAERLKSTIKQVSEQSSDPRTVTARASAKIADNRDGHATAIGRFLEATPQQEDALTTRGHVIMAASAGSGKTRVLAGKVIHHVVDLKTPISSIMAVSFTRKASVELKARILKYAKDSGVSLPAKNDYSAYEGVGTTHKIGRGILTKSGRGYRISTDPKDKKNAVIAGAELSNLIKVAIKQVKMTGSGSAPGPNDMSFFPTVNPKGPPSVSSNDQAIENQSPTTNPSGGSATAFDEYLQNPARYAAITAAAADTLREFLKATFKVTTGQGNYGYWVRVAGPAIDRFGADIANVPLSGGRISWKPPSDRGPGAFFGNSKSPWDANTVQATLENYFGFPQAKNALALISGLASKDPAALKPEDKQVLQDILSNPTVSEGVRARNVMKAAARKRDDSNLTVSEDGIEVAGEVKESRALDNQTGPYFVYANRPAKQWFNIGASDEDFETIDEKGKVKKLSVSDFTRYIGLHKNNLVAPGAAFVSSSGIEPQGFGEDDADTVQVDGVDPEQAQIFAAVYGAYEWLKRNIPDFQGRVDHDDQLILSSKELIEQPRLLRSYQQQYKCVLVDEAQDLNKAQFVMFGLITGSLDPATLKPRADGKMSADTFALIGDDRQCLGRGTQILTPRGLVKIEELHAGDPVLAYRNGKIVSQTVKYATQTQWTWGYTITLESGKTLTMSPTHRLWATEPKTEEDQMVVYLMFRKDMGFRVGITNKGKTGLEEGYTNSYGNRASSERAEKLWVLDVCQGREEALLRELSYSLEYGIPTCVFSGENRGLNQDRIDAVFQRFGKNGARLLEEKHLSIELPHWMSQSYTKHGRARHVVQVLAHTSSGTQVLMEWEGDKFDSALVGVTGVAKTTDDRRRLRRYLPNYREALALAKRVSEATGANISYRLATDEGTLREITASGLHVGMSVPTTDDQETLVHDKITLIERTEGDFFDLDVEDASNIIGNGILTHNSIYRFRGGVPELFTGKSDLVPGGEGWTTKVLDTNFRSGALIVGTAQKIISYNTNQIPMVCKTDPKKGDGSVYRVPVEDISDAGDYVADQIESARKEAEEDGDTKDFYKKYGIALRTNREVYGYVMKLIEKGIPFRSKKNPLKGPVVKPVVALFNLNSTSVKARNQSVLDGVRCPDFGINSENMSKKLVEAGVTDFYNELVNGDAARFVYSRGSYRARLDQYIAYIQEVAGLLASQSADDVMSFVLSYKSPDGTTFIDSICADAKNDAELMEEVQTIADQENDGDITPEMIRNAALGPINPLRVAAGRFPTATAFNDYIQSLNAANDRTEKKEDDVEADAVQIDTVHGWKGLEVSNLYLAMWQGGFPHARSTRDPELMEEERRVAYVAITRAADNLRIIEPRTVQGKPVEPSQFVTEGCIPLMGDTTKEASLRTASLKLSDYHIPTHYTETEYGEEPTDLDMGPALENAWPDYMVGGEEA